MRIIAANSKSDTTNKMSAFYLRLVSKHHFSCFGGNHCGTAYDNTPQKKYAEKSTYFFTEQAMLNLIEFIP